MASAILDTMQGIGGSAAWRWLFYVEGTLTILVAILAMFILPDFPATSGSWLTPLEIRLAERRMRENVGNMGSNKDDEDSNDQMKGLILALSDWKVWWLALIEATTITSVSFGVFFPTLSATMGYSRAVTLLLCAPPWLVATVVAYSLARYVLIDESRVLELTSLVLLDILITHANGSNIFASHFRSAFLVLRSRIPP